jgi:RimJ/RimL family protein N-acetyltransferase
MEKAFGKIEEELPEINTQEVVVENTMEQSYKSWIEKEVVYILGMPDFVLEEQGGVERFANDSFIPQLFFSDTHALLGIPSITDSFIKNNISTQKQLQLLNAIKLSLTDIKLLADNKNANYEYVQFAYQWAGLARDKWDLSQEEICSILDIAKETFLKESLREDVSYLTSLYMGSGLVSDGSKIERFMENITPHCIDKKNNIYHFDQTDNKPIFLKLDTEEKKQFVQKELEEYKVGWSKMFEEYPTVKMYTHYDLPESFMQFVIPENEIQEYFPHIAFNKDNKNKVLREEMKNMLNPIFRKSLQKDMGIDLSDMGAEQAYFVEYISRKTRGEILPLMNFVDTYGTNGIKTFLSIAHGGQEMGDKILLLSEKLLKEPARLLFKTYGDMVDASEETGTLLQESLGEKVTPELIQETKESLLVSGKNLLEKYADQAKECVGVACENLGQELIEKLSLAKKTVFAFGYACKVLVERGEFSLEDFNKAKLVYEKSPVAEEIQKQITTMHNHNTKQYPEKLKVFWRQALKDGLEKPNLNQLVVSVLYEDDVVATMRVIEQEDGSWYGASFNVNPTVQGSRIGTELLKKVLKDLAKETPFVAHCYSGNPMLQTYIDKFGFKKTKEITDYENTECLVYEITLFPEEV